MTYTADKIYFEEKKNRTRDDDNDDAVDGQINLKGVNRPPPDSEILSCWPKQVGPYEVLFLLLDKVNNKFPFNEYDYHILKPFSNV